MYVFLFLFFIAFFAFPSHDFISSPPCSSLIVVLTLLLSVCSSFSFLGDCTSSRSRVEKAQLAMRAEVSSSMNLESRVASFANTISQCAHVDPYVLTPGLARVP